MKHNSHHFEWLNGLRKQHVPVVVIVNVTRRDNELVTHYRFDGKKELVHGMFLKRVDGFTVGETYNIRPSEYYHFSGGYAHRLW